MQMVKVLLTDVISFDKFYRRKSKSSLNDRTNEAMWIFKNFTPIDHFIWHEIMRNHNLSILSSSVH